jgi:hypothetical protein
MTLMVFDTKGIAATGWERIQDAVKAGGEHVSAPHEAWILADPAAGGVRITGPHGFQRQVTLVLDEAPEVITQRVRETLDDWTSLLERAAASPGVMGPLRRDIGSPPTYRDLHPWFVVIRPREFILRSYS